MWIRSAFFIGTVKPGLEAAFRTGIDIEMVPGIQTLPGVVGTRVLWPQRPETGAPLLACQILVEFNGREDVERMLASPERDELRARSARIVAMFNGQVSHIDCEVGSAG